jgi:lysophospholipid acyltransferase (LPLAT)-like uncharacterized protein
MTAERTSLAWRDRAALLAGRGFLNVLARTWRIRVVNGDNVLKLRASELPFIFALWHGQLLPLLWHHRDEGVKILISEHKDGEMVARAAESLGYGLIRGSSTRGADRALISLVRELQAGRELGPIHDSETLRARDGCLWSADQGLGDEPARCTRGSSTV